MSAPISFAIMQKYKKVHLQICKLANSTHKYFQLYDNIE